MFQLAIYVCMSISMRNCVFQLPSFLFKKLIAVLPSYSRVPVVWLPFLLYFCTMVIEELYKIMLVLFCYNHRSNWECMPLAFKCKFSIKNVWQSWLLLMDARFWFLVHISLNNTTVAYIWSFSYVTLCYVTVFPIIL